MNDVRLTRPAAGSNQNITCAADSRFVFEFPTDAASLSRTGDDLVLSFEDGGAILLKEFYKTYSSENMPSFAMDGTEVSGADFFMAMNQEDLMPAAGPSTSGGVNGHGHYSEYGNMDLLDGLARLGGLDLGWHDGVEDHELYGGGGRDDDEEGNNGVTVTPETPEYLDLDTPIVIHDPREPYDPYEPHGPFDPSSPLAQREILRVSERGLRSGTRFGDSSHPVVAEGATMINAPDGIGTIVINGVTIYENGQLTGASIPVEGGELKDFNLDSATGRLEYSFELKESTRTGTAAAASSLWSSRTISPWLLTTSTKSAATGRKLPAMC